MKITINYDLLQKIRESKTGISLKRSTIRYISYNIFYALFGISLSQNFVPVEKQQEKLLISLASASIIYAFYVAITDFMSINTYKRTASTSLKYLSLTLKSLNVNTSYELLQESYKYKTKYKIKFNDYLLPYIKQNKYIIVPVYDNGEIKETSLLQEHVIGSRDYILSQGSPKKVLKYAFNSI